MKLVRNYWVMLMPIMLLVLLFCNSAMYGQILSDPISFRIPLTICNAGSVNCKTIYFGRHIDATYCRDTLYLYNGTKIIEEEQPPKPPSSVFDVRFIDNRTGTGKCLGEGILLDLRRLHNITALDTFRVTLQPGEPDFPMTISWPNLDDFYQYFLNGDVPLLEMREIGGGASEVGMFADTILVLTDNSAIGVRIYAGVPTGIEIQKNIPLQFSLNQNFPNPFNPSTAISYELPKQSHVTLKVFDVLGRELATLVNRVEVAGYKSVRFDASELPSGVYFYRMQAGSFVQTNKMLLMK